MCGILVAAGLDRPLHHRMLAGLRRRGPDGIGFWTDGRVTMAHARLAVVGLDERASEPVENDRYVLAYNGEIYNYLEIARALGLRPATDAEVLLAAWTRWGWNALPKLNGFWAFAVYDVEGGTLSLVRDQVGIKPLYYWTSGRSIVAASTIGALLGALPSKPALEYRALSEYVRYQFTFGDKTFLGGVRKVLPGHIVRIGIDDGAIEDHAYEDIFAEPGDYVATDEWVAGTRETLVQSVLESTASDVAVATTCSGGLDSSAVTRIVEPEIAYHANFADPECNETFYAQRAVEKTPTRLFVVNAREDIDLVARLASIVEDLDEPAIGAVVLPLDELLGQITRRHKVLLTGTGGDELFGGYARYALALGRCYQDSYRDLFARMQDTDSIAARFELAHRKGDPRAYKFYQPEVETTFREVFEASGADNAARMLTFDRKHFLGGLLTIDDRMCGRHGIEARPSLLHQALVRRVVGLAPSELLKDDELKAIGKRVLAPLLPPEIPARTDKMGFTTPIGPMVNANAHRIREQLTSSRFRDLYDLRRARLTADTKFSRETFGLLLLDLWLNRYA